MNKLFLIITLSIFASLSSFSCKTVESSSKKGDISIKKDEPSVKNEHDRLPEYSINGVKYRILQTSYYADNNSMRGIFVARSLKDAVNIISGSGYSSNILEKVDFEKEALIFVFAGTFNTGGYAIELISSEKDKDGNIKIFFSVSSPPLGAIVTQAFTSPSMVVAVEAKEAEAVQGVFQNNDQFQEFEESSVF